ncbi:MAG: dihydropteroate synthase [Candidatus Edwardsbacteria bacterium]|nr:dihydropteroate synthase [Candidatus Edwardsbacteria bacterium]
MIWQCGTYRLDLRRRPLIMGIVNVTPDSFSDGGEFFCEEDAIARGLVLAGQGADIIDIGGESTRPGVRPVSAKEETRRVVPVIRALAKQVNVPLSVDTYKSDVARAALDAGASIINDISAFRFDPAMARLAARTGSGAVLMHIRRRPRSMQQDPTYRDVIGEIRAHFSRRGLAAQKAGVKPEQVAFDPGIGFGKTVAHNLIILRRLPEIRVPGRPLVVGVSRKSFIGKLNRGIGPQARLPGSIAAALAAVSAGANILRVHDVAETRQALKTYFSISKAG